MSEKCERRKKKSCRMGHMCPSTSHNKVPSTGVFRRTRCDREPCLRQMRCREDLGQVRGVSVHASMHVGWKKLFPLPDQALSRLLVHCFFFWKHTDGSYVQHMGATPVGRGNVGNSKSAKPGTSRHSWFHREWPARPGCPSSHNSCHLSHKLSRCSVITMPSDLTDYRNEG